MDFTEEQRNNRERQHANLVPFKPGQSGNPGGRPKGRSLTSILREILDGDTLNGGTSVDGKTVGEKLVEAMLVHAINGNASLIREAFDRIDGKVPSEPPESSEAAEDFIVDLCEDDSHHEADPGPA